MINHIYHGNCLPIMRTFEDNSIDAIVTDPPYGISFMNKKWDYDVPSTEIWKECYRIMKPGAHMLIACGTRTQHRMVVNIEDAGYEIRDLIVWAYGSGFPKSLNISKAIDKELGCKREVVALSNRHSGGSSNIFPEHGSMPITSPSSPLAKRYDGYGTGLKPALEIWTLARKPISEKNIALNVMRWGTGGINVDACRISSHPWKPHTATGLAKNKFFTDGECKVIEKHPHNSGRFPSNLLLDGSQEVLDLFPYTKTGNLNHTYQPRQGNVYGRDIERTHNSVGSEGSASRLFKQIEEGNIDWETQKAEKDLTEQEKNSLSANNVEKNLKNMSVTADNSVQNDVQATLERQLAQVVNCVVNLSNECVTNFVQEVVEIGSWDSNQEASQVILDFIGNYKKCILLQNLVSFVEKWDNIDTTLTTTNLLKLFGCVNRVIKQYTLKTEKLESKRLIYQPKASPSEKHKGLPECTKNIHPTVKPIKLMQYLCRLITPRNGIILDPFAGSGSTLIAASNEGFQYIGIEMNEDYVTIAKQRLGDETTSTAA